MARSLATFDPGQFWEPPQAAHEPIVRPALALAAHDHKKIQLVDLAICYRDILSAYWLVATATTGKMLREMVGLEVQCLRSGLDGGDRQIAECVAGGGVSAVIFLIDPFTRRPHEPGVDAMLKVCNVQDIPIATNVATATALLNSISMLELYSGSDRSSLEEK